MVHIKPVDRDSASAGASHSGRLTSETSSLRKARLGGGAVRVPVNQTTESPLRVFVSAISQSIGTRTPLRKQSTGTFGSSTSRSQNSSSSSTPSNTRSKISSTTVAGSTPSKHATTSRTTLSSAATPSRRSSLSSSTLSSSSLSSATPARKQTTSSFTPLTKKSANTPAAGSSSGSRKVEPQTTPISKKSTLPPRTPTIVRNQNNPTTPISKYSSIPTPAKKQNVLSTPLAKQTATSYTKEKRQNHPTTPLGRPPTTPVNAPNNACTPVNGYGSNAFYTPKSSLPSPLHPRDGNIIPESSRRLHFGINLSSMGGMAEQENGVICTPRTHSSATSDATYSFDKSRLTQIKARKSALQRLLASPAQRVRVLEPVQPSNTPRRHLQQPSDENSAPGGHGDSEKSRNESLNGSPTRRRVANSLF